MSQAPWMAISVVGALLLGVPVNSRADETSPIPSWKTELEDRVHQEQRRWIAPLVVSTGLGLTPFAAMGIDWLANRRCDPERPQCYRALTGDAHFFLAPITIYPLSLSWSSILATEATLAMIKKDIGTAQALSPLVTEWRRRGARHGIASAIVGGVCAAGSVILLAEDESNVLWGLYFVWPVMVGASLSLLHIALTYTHWADVVGDATGEPVARVRRRGPRPRIASVSPMGVTVVW